EPVIPAGAVELYESFPKIRFFPGRLALYSEAGRLEGLTHRDVHSAAESRRLVHKADRAAGCAELPGYGELKAAAGSLIEALDVTQKGPNEEAEREHSEPLILP